MKYNYLSAKYLYDKGLIEDSKNICNKILENEQDNIEVIDLLVQINIKLSLFEEALKYSHKAINLKSDYILYYKHSFILYVLDNEKQWWYKKYRTFKLELKTNRKWPTLIISMLSAFI